MRLPIDDVFNLVGQAVLAVRCGIQRRSNSFESFGYLFISSAGINVIVGKDRDDDAVGFRNFDYPLRQGDSWK